MKKSELKSYFSNAWEKTLISYLPPTNRNVNFRMLQKLRSCQQLFQSLQGSYKHMELSYEIKMEVLSVIPWDKFLDFLEGGNNSNLNDMICKASPWQTPAAILLSSDTCWETWLFWRGDRIHLPPKWMELMLPHDEQRKHLSSSAPTVVIFEKKII